MTRSRSRARLFSDARERSLFCAVLSFGAACNQQAGPGRLLSYSLSFFSALDLPWIAHEVFLGVRWMTFVASAMVLVLAAIADSILRWVIRRKIRDDEAAAEGASADERETYHWFDRGLRAAVPPLSLFVWVYGLFAALSLVLLDLKFRDAAETALGVLHTAKAVGMLAGLVWLAYRVSKVLELRLSTLSFWADSTWDQILFPLAGKTARLTLPLVVIILGVPLLPGSPDMQLLLRNGISLLLIGTVAFVLFQIVQATEKFLFARYQLGAGDNLRARKIHTQVAVLKKMALVIIGVFTLASMLMVFDSVRRFGTSILASAGIAGIIVGFAAQRTIGTLLAGFQIAITQPFRIDDVVVVENEWGRIEDITLTYVVVCIWDLRRLILPITYFIEKPFYNWTLSSSEILGTVFLHVDYAMPIEPLREELDHICENSKFWDGKFKSLLVTDSKAQTLEIRALASGADADKTWDLRCEIREKLIEFIQKNYPESLPRVRAELQPAALEMKGASGERGRAEGRVAVRGQRRESVKT